MGNFEFFLKSDLPTLISVLGRFYFNKKMGDDSRPGSSRVSILSEKSFPFTEQQKSKMQHSEVKDEGLQHSAVKDEGRYEVSQSYMKHLENESRIGVATS